MRTRGRLLAIALLALPGLAGCEWFSTMSRPASVQPHEVEPWPAPEGSVPIDGLPEFNLLTADQMLDPPTGERSLETGRAYYESFCTVCHGPRGLGDGSISGLFPAIPSIVTPQVVGYTDAYLFALVTKGRGLMPEYSRIPRAARWDVVAYVRALSGTAGGEAPGASGETGGAAGVGEQDQPSPAGSRP